MPEAKIRIKIHDCELEFEGDEAFAKEGALLLLKEAIALSTEKFEVANKSGQQSAASNSQGSHLNSGLAISTIAAHLKPDGTQDLAMCALAKLQIIDGKTQAEKSEIWEEMKGASGYFKSTMGRNFPRDLNRMVRGKKINEVGSNVYSLTAASLSELEGKLADVG